MTDELTQQEIEAFLALAEKATPGPWIYEADEGWMDFSNLRVDFISVVDDDGHFIAASRTIAPRLARWVLELEAENEKLRGLLNRAGLPSRALPAAVAILSTHNEAPSD